MFPSLTLTIPRHRSRCRPRHGRTQSDSSSSSLTKVCHIITPRCCPKCNYHLSLNHILKDTPSCTNPVLPLGHSLFTRLKPILNPPKTSRTGPKEVLPRLRPQIFCLNQSLSLLNRLAGGKVKRRSKVTQRWSQWSITYYSFLSGTK